MELKDKRLFKKLPIDDQNKELEGIFESIAVDEDKIEVHTIEHETIDLLQRIQDKRSLVEEQEESQVNEQLNNEDDV